MLIAVTEKSSQNILRCRHPGDSTYCESNEGTDASYKCKDAKRYREGEGYC